MSYNTSGKNILGGGLPNVYIHNIELGIDSNSQRQKSKNPHIKEQRDYKNLDSKSSSDSRMSSALKTSISMSIKVSDISDITNSREDLKYIKVLVVQCRSKKQHDAINRRPFNFFGSLTKRVGQRNFEAGPVKTKIIPLNQMFGFSYDTSSGFDFLGMKRSLADRTKIPFSLSFARDGLSFYSIPLKCDFIIDESEGGSRSSFLSYFAFCYYDKEQRQRDLGIRKLPSIISDLFSIGKISSEVVLEGRSVNKNSFAFKDMNNLFWNGPVHQMSNGQWMKYSSHTDSLESSRLNLVRVHNTKIRDNRIYDKLMKLNVNLSQNNSYVIRNQRLIDSLRKSSNLDLIRKKNNIFSDFYITRDKTNNARFIFSINAEEMIKKNTDFPTILSNIKATDSQTFEALLREAKITKLLIKRDRIRSREVVTSNFEKTRIVDDQQTVIIARSADDGNGILVRKGNSNQERDPRGSSLPPKAFGVIDEISLSSRAGTAGVRHFTGTDFDMSSQKEGEYQYSLEMEIEDPMLSFLKRNLRSLQRYITGTRLSPGIEQYYKDSTSDKSYYDELVGQFNTNFLSFYNRKYGLVSDTVSNNPLFSAIGFVTKLSYQISTNFLSNDLSEISVLNYLLNISSPTSGSPEGINKLLQIMYNMESTLKRMIQKNSKYIKYRGDSSADVLGKTSTQGSTRSRVGVYVHTFNNIFSTQGDASTGYDFLFSRKGQFEKNLDGLVILGKQDLKERFSLETSKYFTSDAIDVIIRDNEGNIYNEGDKIDNTKFSFLTVSNVFLKQEDKSISYSLINSCVKERDREELNDILTQISLINQNKENFYSSRASSPEDRTTENLIENFEVFQGAAIASRNSSRRDKRKESTSKQNLFFSPNAKTNLIDENENIFKTQQRDRDRILLPEGTKEFLKMLNHVLRDNFLEDSNSIKFYSLNDNNGGKSFKSQLISNCDRRLLARSQ